MRASTQEAYITLNIILLFIINELRLIFLQFTNGRIPYGIMQTMTLDDRRRSLAAKLKGARLKANAQRKYSRTSQGQPQSVVAKRHQSLTQAYVARKLGISQSFLSKLEKGQQEPNFLLVELLARYYGVKLSELATYSRDENRFGHHLND
jgi:ribosome-binding protein aMBF1 (putative translation factor)